MITTETKMNGLVYTGSGKKNFTYGRFYQLKNPNSYSTYAISDNDGRTKIYATNNFWCKSNFKIMKHVDYVLWSRSIKLRELKKKMV